MQASSYSIVQLLLGWNHFRKELYQFVKCLNVYFFTNSGGIAPLTCIVLLLNSYYYRPFCLLLDWSVCPPQKGSVYCVCVSACVYALFSNTPTTVCWLVITGGPVLFWTIQWWISTVTKLKAAAKVGYTSTNALGNSMKQRPVYFDILC